MSKHTQGPWVFEYGSIYTPTGKQVCRPCDKKTQTYKNWEANARLIAAAPELLEACQALLTYHDYEGYAEAADKARAAIAKAKGDEQ